MRVIAGDVGGTKVFLQICESGDSQWRVVAEQRFESRAYPGLLPMIEEFLRNASLRDKPNVSAACFGIAGPITENSGKQTAKVTNLPWVVDSAALTGALKIKTVRLINDFQASAYGIEVLGPGDLVALQTGTPQARAPRAVIGAGTGLGQGLLIWEQDHYEAIGTEGGHADFAPIDELQTELLHYLTRRFGRASYERVLSGPGLANIYCFLQERAGLGSVVPAAFDRDDPAAAISEAALSQSDQKAVDAMQMFVRTFGAQAGNVALSYLATGGIFIAGGIAPKVLPKLSDGTFMRAFLDKGRMASLLATVPVYVVMNPRVGLMGAALAASRL